MSRKNDKKYFNNKKSRKNNNTTLTLEETLNKLLKEHFYLLQNNTKDIEEKNDIYKHSESLEISLKDENINTLDKIYLLEYLNKIIYSIEKKI